MAFASGRCCDASPRDWGAFDGGHVVGRVRGACSREGGRWKVEGGMWNVVVWWGRVRQLLSSWCTNRSVAAGRSRDYLECVVPESVVGAGALWRALGLKFW